MRGQVTSCNNSRVYRRWLSCDKSSKCLQCRRAGSRRALNFTFHVAHGTGGDGSG